jgi:hypothetical protein
MPQKSETPRGGGASRNSFPGCFREPFSPFAVQAQFLITAHHVRPELAAMVAALAFGGGAYHGRFLR